MTSPKKRARPAQDSAEKTIREVYGKALAEYWSPRRLVQSLRARRHTCRKVWNRAILTVLGKPLRAYPDTRQLIIPGAE